VKPPRFDYVRPDSLEEALAVLAEHGDEAKALAGGQSLVPMLNMRLARPAVLVDVNRIAGLDGITADNGLVRLGALVRQASCERAEIVRRRLPLVAECLPHVGHHATRNRGTVGGSLAHGDSKAELPLALVALGGSALVRGPEGERIIPAEELFVGHYTTSLEPEELLVESLWPAAAPGFGSAFEEFALRTGDYALALAACSLEVRAGRVSSARVAFAGPSERPLLSEASKLLVGAAPTSELARAVGAAAQREIEPNGSLHASGPYLRHLIGLLVERVVDRAWRRATGGQRS
jgi:CO/xanthine dehydrogenase FAD-binding subunit